MDRTGVRALCCFGLLGLVAPLLAGRLAWLQLGHVADARGKVALQRNRSEELPAPRGTIVDRHGRPMAYDRPAMEVQAEVVFELGEADPAGDFARQAGDLVGAFDAALRRDPQGAGVSPNGLRERLLGRLRSGVKGAVDRPGVVRTNFALSYAVESAVVFEGLERVEAGRSGVHLHYLRRWLRTYPERDYTLGTVGFDGWAEDAAGQPRPILRGIEALAGLAPRGEGERESWIDAKTRRYWTARGRLPDRATLVESSLDLDLQKAAHKELQRAADAVTEHYGTPPEWGALLLAEIESAEILAMASFVPGETEQSSSFAPLQCLCPPGSVVKPLVFSLALERGVLDWNNAIFDCRPTGPKGAWYVPGTRRPIHDEHPCGDLSPYEILVVSSNIGAAQVGLLLGREGMHDYLQRYRFGHKTALGLPGEVDGSLATERLGGVLGMPERTFWGYTGPSLSFGYEYNITPVQLLRAYVTLLSGRQRELTLYRSYRIGDDTFPVEPPPAGERFLSDVTLLRLREAMAGVVSDYEEATGRHLYQELKDMLGGAEVPVAGKTGTSEYTEVREGKSTWIRTASFAGFAPVEEPRYVAVCVLQKPEARAFWGGRYAAPAAGRLLLSALSPSPRRPEHSQVSAGDSRSLASTGPAVGR